MRVLQILTVILSVSITGCSGVKFASDPNFNRNLPQDFVKRDLYEKTDIFKYRLDDLVGHILVCKTVTDKPKTEDCELKLTRIIKDNTSLVTEMPKQAIYRSKVNSAAATQGSYLAFTANFSVDQIAEVTITDSTLIAVKAEDVPIDALKTYVTNNPNDGLVKRYWIQAALLATLVQKDYTKIKADASGVVGNTTGIGGSVYNEHGSDSYDWRISMLLPDIDKDLDKKFALSGEDTPGSGLTIRSIQGLNQLQTAPSTK